MAYGEPDPRARAQGLALAVLVQLAVGWVLVTGLASSFLRHPEESLATFTVSPLPAPPPPVPVEPPREQVKAPEGAAAPPNIRSRATEVAAPEPIVIVPLPPPPIIVAPKPADAADPSSGAADRAGPGTGAGGVGDGFGAGRGGRGRGSGLDPQPPRHVRGELRDRDYPAAAVDAGAGGAVEVRYLVWTDGRVRDCRIETSSGNRVLDETTCRLIRERFRFRPAMDEGGRPEPAWLIERHEWVLERVAGE